MATTIGRLAVAVLGNIDDFKKNFGEAKKGVQDFSKEVKKADVDLKRVGRNMTLIGTTIVGSLFAVTKAVADNADQIDLFAKRTGLTREELQKLAYAAMQEGSSIEVLATGIARLSQNMYDASKGTGEAVNAFKSLGISIKDSAGNLRSADDVLGDIAEKFKSMPNDTERSAVAMKLFGRGGAQLIPFLRKGKEGIEELKKEAVALGYVLDEQTIIQMEQLGDELEAVKTGFTSIGRQIAADTAPALLEVAQGTKELFKWVHLLPDDVRKFVTQGTLATGVLLTLTGLSAGLVAKIGALRIALSALNTSFAPFLVGSAIFLGLSALVGLFGKIRDNARLAALDIKKTLDINDLYKERERLKKDIAKRELEIYEERTLWSQFKKKITGQGNTFRPDWTGLNESKKRLKEVEEQIKKILSPTVEPDLSGFEGGKSKFDYTEFMADLSKSLKNAETEVKTFGNQNELASKKADLLKSAIVELIKQGYNPSKTSLGNLVSQYKQFAAESESLEKALKREQESVDLLNQAKQEKLSWDNRELSSLDLLAAKLEAQAILDEKNAEALREYAEAMRELAQSQKAFENQKTAYDSIFVAQQKLSEMTGQGRKEWEDFADELERLAGAEGVIESTSNALLKLADAIRQAGEDNEAKELHKQLAQIAHETAQFELDTQITQLENQKALLAIQGDSLENREKELELNKQIAKLQIEKLNLDIASLEAQKEKAAATQNEVEVQRINLEIAKMRAAIEGYQFQVELDTRRYQQQLQQPITNLQNELRGATSSALAAGLQDGGVIGAIDSLGDYMANKFRTKIADAMTDALFNTTFGQNFKSFFTRLFGGAAAANAGAQAGAAGAAATGTAAAGGLAGFFASPWALALGGLGLIGSLFAGSRGSTTINIQASAGNIVADYATANFKEVVLPSSYMGQGVPSSAVAPVYNVNVSVTAAGSLIAERDLDKRIQSSVEAGIAKANAKATKWQAVTTVSG